MEVNRCQANSAHIRQLWPDFGLVLGHFQYENLQTLLRCSLLARQRFLEGLGATPPAIDANVDDALTINNLRSDHLRIDHLRIGHLRIGAQVKLLGGVRVMEHMRAWVHQGGLLLKHRPLKNRPLKDRPLTGR